MPLRHQTRGPVRLTSVDCGNNNHGYTAERKNQDSCPVEMNYSVLYSGCRGGHRDRSARSWRLFVRCSVRDWPSIYCRVDDAASLNLIRRFHDAVSYAYN